MGNYLKGNTWSEVYKKVLCVGGDSADHAGLTASEKNVWTDDGSAGKTLSAFQLSSDTLLMITTNKLAFTDTATYVNNPGTGHLKLVGQNQLTIESGSTGFTVDSAGDIVLDADGADVSLKDNTVQFIKFTNNAGDCEVYNGVADKDIIFKDLGGNTIMTLDGSAESLLMATNKKIEFSTTDEHIYGDGTDIHFGVGVNGDINIPANIGLTFGHATGSKIEGDGTDIAIDSTGNINITSTVSEAAAILLNASGTNGGIDINSGTLGFDLDTTGDIHLRTTKNGTNAIYLETDGGTSESIKIHTDQGTSASSIFIVSDDGGIDVNAGKGMTIDTADTTTFTMAANHASAKVFSLVGTNADGSGQTDIKLDADGDIHLSSNITGAITNGTTEGSISVGTLAGIQIGTDLADVDVVLGHTTSNVLVSDDFKVNGDAYIYGALSVNGSISYSSLTVSQEAAAATATVLTLDQSSHSDTDGHRQSQIVFTGERSGAEEVTMAKIIGAHDGGDDDQKGYLEFTTNTSGDDATPTTALKLSADKTATFAGDLSIPAAKKLYLDGGNNTYIHESSGDTVKFYIGGADRLVLDTASEISMSNNDEGTSNTIFGSQAAQNLDAGSNYNVFIGHEAAEGALDDATNNVIVGYRAAQMLSTGDGNVCLGTSSLATATSSSYNVAIGFSTLNQSASSSYSTAVGGRAGLYLSSGANATYIGYEAGLGISGSVQTGDNNTAVGYRAGLELEGAAHSNTFVGGLAGNTTEAGVENTCLGYNTECYDDTATNQIVIGNNITAIDADNAIFIGNDTRQIRCDYGSDQTWDAPSDERIKNITGDSPLGLDFINAIPVKTFTWKSLSEYPEEFNAYNPAQTEPSDTLEHHGLIAQNVKAALDEAGVTDFSGWDEDSDGMQTVGESAFVYPLIKAIQELSAKVEALESAN